MRKHACVKCGEPMDKASIWVRYDSLPGRPQVGWHLACVGKDPYYRRQVARQVVRRSAPEMTKAAARQYVMRWLFRLCSGRGRDRVAAAAPFWKRYAAWAESHMHGSAPTAT